MGIENEYITIRTHSERPTIEFPNGSRFVRIGSRFVEATGRFMKLLDPEGYRMAEIACWWRSAFISTWENPPMGTLWWSKDSLPWEPTTCTALVKEGPKAMVVWRG